MRRKIIPIALIIIFMLSLTACTTTQPAEQPTTQENEMTVDEFEKSEPTEEPTEETAESTGDAYVGSVNSDKYHYPDCRWAQKIKPDNEVWFASKEEAEEAGYIPCKVCNP